MKLQGDDIQYDRRGHMLYHPEFHENHGKPFSESEREYLCKYYEHDGRFSISLALGKTENAIKEELRKLRKAGLYEYYKNANKHW